MNYGQTAIGEVRVIANYLGINPWEFESPFVLTNEIWKYVYIYVLLHWRFVTLCNRRLPEFESPFVLAIYIQYRECRYVCIMEIRHSLQYWIAVVRISLFSNKFIIEMYRTST